MDFFVWVFFKQEVYSTPVNSEEELRGRIGLAAQRLRGKLSFKMTVGAMRKRARACEKVLVRKNSRVRTKALPTRSGISKYFSHGAQRNIASNTLEILLE
ncbi:hypothetical protein J6590_083962, partial [Homalodisca vitripennis]